MAFDAFLKIVGPEIQSGSKQQDIPIFSFSFEVAGSKGSPDKGLTPGVRKGKMEFHKEFDEATPKLALALANNTRFQEMIFSFVRSDTRTRKSLIYYRVRAKLPRIVSIRYSAGAGPISGGAKHNEIGAHEFEIISIADFQDVAEENIQWEDSKDNW